MPKSATLKPSTSTNTQSTMDKKATERDRASLFACYLIIITQPNVSVLGCVIINKQHVETNLMTFSQ